MGGPASGSLSTQAAVLVLVEHIIANRTFGYGVTVSVGTALLLRHRTQGNVGISPGEVAYLAKKFVISPGDEITML